MVRLESIVTGLRLASVIGAQSVKVVPTHSPNSREVVWRGRDERILDLSGEPRLHSASVGRNIAVDTNGHRFRYTCSLSRSQ